MPLTVIIRLVKGSWLHRGAQWQIFRSFGATLIPPNVSVRK
jgi:hypothetical protein